MRGYDGDMFDDEHYVCQRCGLYSVYGVSVCGECDAELTSLNESTYYPTKAEKREQRRNKRAYGPVRHLPGDFRPAKTRWE